MRNLLFLLFFPTLLVAQTTFEKGEIYFKNEQFSKAKPLFQTYLKEHPNHKKTMEYLGDIAGYEKDWDTALDYYVPLVESSPKNATYHFKTGGVYGMKALENKLKAVAIIDDIKHHFETAAQLDANHIEVRWALVEFYMQLPGIFGGSVKKATKYADQLLNISPIDGYMAKGYIAEYDDEPEDAERYYRKGMQLANTSLGTKRRNSLNYQIGKVAAQYNMDASLGIDSLQAYIVNHSVRDGVPKDWAYYRMAQIYKNAGEKQTALQWINKALRDRPNFKEAKEEKKEILSL